MKDFRGISRLKPTHQRANWTRNGINNPAASSGVVFIGRISEIVKDTIFASSKELESTMKNYLKVYNHHIPQRNIDHLTPIQKLKEWRLKRPDLFKKRVYDLSGLDSRHQP